MLRYHGESGANVQVLFQVNHRIPVTRIHNCMLVQIMRIMQLECKHCAPLLSKPQDVRYGGDGRRLPLWLNTNRNAGITNATGQTRQPSNIRPQCKKGMVHGPVSATLSIVLRDVVIDQGWTHVWHGKVPAPHNYNTITNPHWPNLWSNAATRRRDKPVANECANGQDENHRHATRGNAGRTTDGTPTK